MTTVYLQTAVPTDSTSGAVLVTPATSTGAPLDITASGPATAVARLLSAAANTNDTLVRAGVGYVKHVTLFNAAATDKFLKLYDKATAPVVGTNTPIATFHLPARSDVYLDFPAGLKFALGIGYGISGAAADADTTALAAGDVTCMNIGYI